jgi:hypothetical protein
LLFAASLCVAAQDQRDSAANRVKIIALENARNQAEEAKDARALDLPRDNSLVYTDYHGTLKAKADFLASVKAAGHRPEQQVTESMNAHFYRTPRGRDRSLPCKRGVDQGKPYPRRGRFTVRGFIRMGRG